MKQYPEIASSLGQSFREFPAYVFDKLDGSNLRFEWSRRQGWNKFGTRSRLFDESDEVFGKAIPLFHTVLADDLERIARKERWDNITAYAEFWGENSFAGLHSSDDEKQLTLFDVNVYKKGFLGPKEFLHLFQDLPIPAFLGKVNWTRHYVSLIRQGEIEGITFEGVVGKGGEGHKIIMAKAKTQAWVDKVKAIYNEHLPQGLDL